MIDAAIASLIRNLNTAATRVSPSTETAKFTATTDVNPSPSNALPRVIYTRISNSGDYTDSGSVGVSKARYQIDVFADKMTDAQAIVDRIAAPVDRNTLPGLDGYKGTIQGTTVLRIYFDSDRFERAEKIEGSSSTIARCLLDLIVDYRE